MEIDEYLIIENENQEKFFDCKYGYIFSNPQYNLYVNCCKIKKECNCLGCTDFDFKYENSSKNANKNT